MRERKKNVKKSPKSDIRARQSKRQILRERKTEGGNQTRKERKLKAHSH